MDTDPKIVGRENRPHMNALVHRTFGYGPLEVTRSLLLTRMRPMFFAKHVISLALGWSTGPRCTDIPAQRQGEAMLEGARVHTTLPATLHQWRTRPSSNSALVDLRRADGSVIAAKANMYQPFPSASTPIWAVRSYRVGR